MTNKNLTRLSSRSITQKRNIRRAIWSSMPGQISGEFNEDAQNDSGSVLFARCGRNGAAGPDRKANRQGHGRVDEIIWLDKPPAPAKDYKQLYLGAYGRWIKLNMSQGSHTDVCAAAKQMVEYADKWDDHATVVEVHQYLRESDCG